MATIFRYGPLVIILLFLCSGCKKQQPVESKKTEPIVIVKPKQAVLSRDQRRELGFPEDLIAQIELAAAAEAEPFFITVEVHSENMKGEAGFEKERLAGFSVHTKRTDELMASFRAKLRARGYLIFRSHKSYARSNDVVTVVKGRNSYDILKMQGTEAPNYQLDTKAVVAWLRERQKDASFVITGAGPDWVEAEFTKKPQYMEKFAKQIVAFAPDVLERGHETTDKLVEHMNRMNGFSLVWD